MRLCVTANPARDTATWCAPVLTSPDRDRAGKRKADGSLPQRAISDGSGRKWRRVSPASARELPAQLVVRSVGYRGAHARAAVRTTRKRDHPQRRRPNHGSPNEYVVGRIARADRGDRDQQEDAWPPSNTLIKIARAREAGACASFPEDHADQVADWLAARQSRSWSRRPTGR